MTTEQDREATIARNLAVVQEHFHNENPEDVDKAIALYADEIVWEAPSRGVVHRTHADVKAAYLDIFDTIHITRMVLLRETATETSVFTDHIGEGVVIGNKMPNLPFGPGTQLNARLVHNFELKDGRITRETAYEIWREAGSAVDHDDIPAGATEVQLS
ncbi:MAG: nuclear transport factor 2 family protein [Mycobacterium sp.]|nr:nuclear transport factor 2 family protein [Mycobacterium sp.]